MQFVTLMKYYSNSFRKATDTNEVLTWVKWYQEIMLDFFSAFFFIYFYLNAWFEERGFLEIFLLVVP